jgi:flagella basal body P-ring formation protein FlgA
LLKRFCRGFLATCLALISTGALRADNQAVNAGERDQILSQGRQVTASEIKPVLVDYLLKSTPWKQPEIEVRSVEGLKGVEVPEGDVSFNLLSGTAVAGRNGILALIEAVQDGKGVRCFWITGAIRVNAEIVAAAKRIPQGERVTSDEVVRTSFEISDLHAGYFRDLEDVVGKVSRRTFSPGDPITRENLSEPFLIRHGDIVQLRLVRNGIVLTSSVKAEQNGRLGEFIKVRNVEFSSVLKARVTGRAEVSIE